MGWGRARWVWPITITGRPGGVQDCRCANVGAERLSIARLASSQRSLFFAKGHRVVDLPGLAAAQERDPFVRFREVALGNRPGKLTALPGMSNLMARPSGS